MGYGSIVSIFDRLSVKTVLTNHTGSYIGFAATIALIIVCIVVLVPPVDQYFKGAYFESQFASHQMPVQSYLTGEDIIMAISFKDKKTGQYADHTEILQKVNSAAYYFGYSQIFKTLLKQCKPSVFLDSINPMQVKECIMLPSNLQVNVQATRGEMPYLHLLFKTKCDDAFKCNQNSPYKTQVAQFIKQLSTDYYYEVIFNSKIVDDKGKYQNQFHKIYSTEFQSPDALATWSIITMSQKKYFIDDSILPWRNNQTYSSIYWDGGASGKDIPEAFVVNVGFIVDYYVKPVYYYAYRYYKKLDSILGMIGGACFLIFVLFWIPFSYINRTLQKMRNAEQLLILKDDLISTQQNLHKVKIPFYHVFTRYLPGNKDHQIIQQAQGQIDVVRLIKKMKVTHRNLRTKGIDLTFKSKDVDLNSIEPLQFLPDRPALQNLEITLEAHQSITKSNNTVDVYQNNPVALALTENNSQKIDAVMQDQIYQKNRSKYKKFTTFKSKYIHCLSSFIKFFDIFGAKPMLTAEPQNSSCWGFLLTLSIITLSILTFALTIRNMGGIQVITSHKYERPLEHNYKMTSGKNFRFAFCFDSLAADQYLTGATKAAHLTFFKRSKKEGVKQIPYQRMLAGQFMGYFKLDPQDPYSSSSSQNCFRAQNGHTIQMGGSYETTNQAYFGARIDPYCSGSPVECQARKNQTVEDFLKFINIRTFGIFINQNKYSPDKGTLIPGVVVEPLSQSVYTLNGNLLRTQTLFVSSIQLLDDTSKSFLRTQPIVLDQTMSYSVLGDRNQQKKGDPTATPGYVVQLRPNGQVMQVIHRSYKIDFLFGIIGGVFAFWYFFIHFFAKMYNSYKVRAKLAQVLHQEDGYDQSTFVHLLYMTKFPSFLLCCSGLRNDLQRVAVVDKKMERDLDYLKLAKYVDNCYRLSSSVFASLEQKDLSLIYFRQKIDESDLVRPKRISQIQKVEFQDDEFLQFDDQYAPNNIQNNSSFNATGNLLADNSKPQNNLNLQKIINMGKSVQTSPLYDPYMPYKKENHLTRILKKLDVFKCPAQLTLDGQRDVKSIFGGVMFFVVAVLVIIVVVHFLTIYSNGTDYTVSHRSFIDDNLSQISPGGSLGQLYPGINVITGQNFKFAITFNKKDHYYPHKVSQYIGPIGIRLLQYTITKNNGQINQTYEAIELQQCNQNYLQGFMGPYNDPQAFGNLTLGYCLPDGKQISTSGTPSDPVRKYFKTNIYNKYNNATGRSFLNSFFKIYLTQYYMSVPRLDVFSQDFQYEMIKFNLQTEAISLPIEENKTLSKVIMTDKYQQRSRQTYNDRSPRGDQRLQFNQLSAQSTRNLTFYYSGMIDQYTLDYPGGAQLLGLVGGVIVMFVYIIYSCVSSFNQYRMKYVIGQRLYTFDKKLSGLSKEKGKKLNLKRIQEATKKINNFNEMEILLAWVLNPLGYLRDNYNFNKTLRRVTLLIDKVEHDIDLYNVYRDLFTFRDVIDKRVRLNYSQDMQNPVGLSSVYLKHIYQSQTVENHIPIISKESKKHKLSSYQQFKISRAIDAKVNPQAVLRDKVLNRAFGVDDGSSLNGQRFRMNEEREQIIGQVNPDRRSSIHNSTSQLRQTQIPQESSEKVQAFQIE